MQLVTLSQLAKQLGHDVVMSVLAKKIGTVKLSSAELNQPDIWVVRMDQNGDYSDDFLGQIETEQVPLMFDDLDTFGAAPSLDALRRFSLKMEACLADHRSDGSSNRIDQLWVLAASAGGPEAVSEFLRALPKFIPRIAFVYVQHINTEMLPSLHKTVAHATDMNVCSMESSVLALENTIYLVSPKYKIEISDLGGLLMTSEAWSGDYSPSANQVIAKVAKVYGNKCGAIIFSGMGDDGAESGRLMKRVGAKVWLQSADSCTIDSMPLSVQKTGCAEFIGTPEDLANKFTQEILKPKMARQGL